MTKKDMLFEAILSFLLECDVAPLKYEDYDEVIYLVHANRKIDAIKHLRTVTRREVKPSINGGALIQGNELYNMLVEIGHPLVEQVKSLGLKRAKDIVDVIAATTF